MQTADIRDSGRGAGLGCFAWPISGKGETFCSDQTGRIFAAEVDRPAVLEALLDPTDADRLSAALATQLSFYLELKLRNGRWVAERWLSTLFS